VLRFDRSQRKPNKNPHLMIKLKTQKSLAQVASAEFDSCRTGFSTAPMRVLAIILLIAAFAGSASAQSLNWTGSGTTLAPGAGAWDATTANQWNDGTGTSGDTAWVNNNNAIFGGANGTYAITVGAAISANTIAFANSGYTLSASSAQTISITTATSGDTTPQIQVASGTTNTIGNNILVQNTVAIPLVVGTHGSTAGGEVNINDGGMVKQNSSNGGGVDGNGTVVNVNAGGTLSGPNNGGSSGSISIGLNTGSSCTVNVEGGAIMFGTGKQFLAVGAGGAGILTVDSGTVSLNAAAANGIELDTAATGSGTINLNGGMITTPLVKKVSTGTATFNFNGGTLQPNLANTSFLTGLNTANVRNGGAVIDNNTFNITIGQALAHSTIGGDNAIDGGLTKLNTGTLTLSGANTYTGPTIVSNGTLVTTTASIGGGAYTVEDGTTLTVQVNSLGTSLTNSSLTLGNSGNVTNTFTLGANASQTAPVIVDNGILSLNGTVIINISASGLSSPGTYPLITYGSFSGSGSFVVGGSLPSINGYTVVLTNDTVNKVLELAYTVVPSSVQWGVGNGNWDTTSLNWQPLGGGSATNYTESDLVTFNDNSSGPSPITVTITSAHSPGGIIDNSIKDYILTDGGNGYSIAGSGGLTKTNSGMLTLSVNASYAGNTTISGGTLALTNSGSIPNSPIISVASGTTLDVSGRSDQTLTLNNGQTLSGSGSINGNLTILNGATVMPENGNTIGTLTVKSNILVNGSLVVEINRTNAQTSDELTTVSGSFGGSGSIVVNNVGPVLQNGDTFQLLNQACPYSITLPSLPPGHTWLNNLGSIGSISVGGAGGSLVWTGSGTTNAPGNGTWDTTTTDNWNNGIGTAGDSAWTNGATAIFGGADGTYAVTVDSVIASSIWFQNSGYTLSASSPTIIPLGTSTASAYAFIWGSSADTITNTIGTNVTVLGGSTCYMGAVNGNQGGTLIIAGGGEIAGGNSGNSLLINGNGTVVSVQTNGTFGFAIGGPGGAGVQIANSVSATVLLSVDGGTVTIPGQSEKLYIGGAGYGTLNLNSGVVNVVSNSTQGIILANAVNTSEGTINLNGGTLITPFITKGSGYSAQFYFNGGTLKATENQNAFLQGLDQVGVLTNGAVIDSSGFNVEIDLPLLSESSPDGGLTKLNAGLLTLGGACTYTGPTTVSNGTLALTGSGSVGDSGSISIASGATFDVSAVAPYDVGASQTLAGSGTVNGSVQVDGTISPGFSAVGTLTFNNNLTFDGNLLFELDKSLAQSNSLVVVSGVLNNTGTGTLSVTNLGPALVVGDKFTLFSQPLPNGNNLTIAPLNGVTFANNLAVDGSIQVLTATNLIASNPTNITVNANGSTLTLSWPLDHLGWIAQSNSVSLASSNYWFDIPSSQNGTNLVIQINRGLTNVFYRLRHP
jgi:autotransporter-associated beta strand protein